MFFRPPTLGTEIQAVKEGQAKPQYLFIIVAPAILYLVGFGVGRPQGLQLAHPVIVHEL